MITNEYELKTLDNKYELGKILGFGEYSKVKQCKRLKNNRKFAIKIFSKKVEKNPIGYELIQKEISILNNVKSENIIKMFDFSLRSGIIQDEYGLNLRNNVSYIVLEYMEKGDLFDLLKIKNSFPTNIARFFFKQIINGIYTLQKINIAHRDLKLENLVINNEYTLKLIDFGFSCNIRNLSDNLIKYNETLGTQGYIAPEIMNENYYSDKVDIFSAGVILFCLLIGHAPFYKASKHDKLYSLFMERDNKEYWEKIRKKKAISQDTINILNRMLAYDPLERIDIEEVYSSEFFNGETASVNEVKEFFCI